jgi:DNA-binding NtrC family response regulator
MPNGTGAMARTVLLVEDDAILRLLIVEALSLIDLDAAECGTAAEAMAILEAEHRHVLVLTDICMPGEMDGLELAKTIWGRWPQLPVIVSSGNRVVSHGSLPANAMFMRKPWALDTLHETVKRLLDN